MSIPEIQALEGGLLNDISSLEWRKYQQRFPNVWRYDHFESEDRSAFPLWVAFRFEQESSETIAKLKQVIENYKGKFFGVWLSINVNATLAPIG
ncbi:hypothetical protein HX882_03240 [Pseudomonas gingeri]|uniref:Uncharacterized protein n=1 Tax=Pseudomonas gingeri TaxID=117681 RepID=A0A7Y7X9Y8_9PSED|nr:hypothetical protein [Pseudomonas gingeri]NWB94902.1 hypothetical protein [Pseudomonas gingeri]